MRRRCIEKSARRRRRSYPSTAFVNQHEAEIAYGVLDETFLSENLRLGNAGSTRKNFRNECDVILTKSTRHAKSHRPQQS